MITFLRFLCVLCGQSFLFILSAGLAANAFGQTREPPPPDKGISYQINLAIDFDNRSYSGTEKVHWINQGEHPTSTLFFHLYPNMRTPDYVPSSGKSESGQPAADEPVLEIKEVRLANNAAAIPFAVDDQQTTLRINLREAVPPNGSAEIQIKFKGSVPEIDAEETGLVTHVLQQVSAAIRSTREIRRARDTNFVCRGVMLLSTSFPILAARNGDEWIRKIESTIGDSLTTDTADYDVTITAAPGVMVFTPVAGEPSNAKDDNGPNRFIAGDLRDFAIVAGRNLRAEISQVGNVTARSIFRPDHEVVGLSVLKIAANAVRIYENKFGTLPMKSVTVVEAPLVATLGSAEFAGMGVIASAFYVDFDSATMRNMPDVIREQRASVEDSREWTVAHVVAHQWWGATVGNDAGREPILDESLSNWSALLYYRQTHGEEQAENALEEQLRGVYKVYRTFGGDDMEASRSSREYRNSFQYAAIVSSKGALMFEALRKLIGDEKFYASLRDYYEANSLEVADLDDLRGAFIAGAPVEQRRAVSRTFDRWLSSKRGDEDIGPPDPRLAQELGLPARPDPKGGPAVFSPFAKLGKFFWQQMTKIR